MAQTTELIATLKKSLKQAGLTYANVAEALNLSEHSVKRMFSQHNFTLERLDSICQLLEIEFSDLLRQMEGNRQSIRQLHTQQEEELVADLRLLLVAVSVVNGWTAKEIVANYYMTASECTRHLAHLDRLKLIDLQPGNRVKLRVDANFSWRSRGPIERFFADQVQADFFSSRFEGSGEYHMLVQGMISDSSNAQLQKLMQRVAREFEQLRQEDQALPREQRHGSCLSLAIRPWQLPQFAQWRREQPAA